jgi:hypothetical protein
MSNTSAETLREYIYVCAGCDLLALATRRDQLTCSTACRVRANRSGDLPRLRAEAERDGCSPASILQAAAVCRLAPDAVDDVLRGRLSPDEAQRQARAAFFALVARAYPDLSATEEA